MLLLDCVLVDDDDDELAVDVEGGDLGVSLRTCWSNCSARSSLARTERGRELVVTARRVVEERWVGSDGVNV